MLCALLALTAGLAYRLDQEKERYRMAVVTVRSSADALVDYILSDLRDQLEPIGRTDVLEPPTRKTWEYLDSIAPEDDSPAYRHRRAVAMDNIGEILFKRGDLEGANNAFRQSLQLAEELSKEDPSNPDWQRSLAIGYSKIGDVQTEQGDLVGALLAQRKSLALLDRLAQGSPEDGSRQHDLALAHERVGATLEAQGELQEALKAYQARQIIASSLHTLDPKHTEWQRDLAVSYGTVGNMLDALGDSAGALAAYRRFADLAEQLATRDAKQPEWQRDCAISQEKIGDILASQGDLTGATAAYQRLADISARLAALDPRNIHYSRDLAAARSRLSAVREQLGKLREATELQQMSADSLDAIATQLGTADARREAGRAFGRLAWYLLMQRQPQKAADTAKKAAKLDPADLHISLVLAHTLLLSGSVAEAEKIYRQHHGSMLDGKRSWSTTVSQDFRTLISKGIVHPDMRRIEMALIARS